jgi:ATP-dependent Lon protease
VTARLRRLAEILARELEVVNLGSRIQSEVQEGIDKTQREYYLREQLKAIQRELGEDDPQQAEINELREKVEQAGMPEDIKARAVKEIDRMSRIPSASPEVGVIRTYVDWLIGLPWNVSTDDQLDIREAARILEEDHYGLEKIKDRILEYLAVRSLADTIVPARRRACRRLPEPRPAKSRHWRRTHAAPRPQGAGARGWPERPAAPTGHRTRA